VRSGKKRNYLAEQRGNLEEQTRAIPQARPHTTARRTTSAVSEQIALEAAVATQPAGVLSALALIHTSLLCFVSLLVRKTIIADVCHAAANHLLYSNREGPLLLVSL